MNKISKKRLAELDDDDVPTTRPSKSIQEIEEEQGHGFWGNSTTGYIYDKDTKEEKRYKER
jgi:hypothetical protein